MSRVALIEDLRRKAAEDSEALWRDAKAEAEKYRLEAAREIEDRRSGDSARRAATARRLEEAAASLAQREAREILAKAATALADRLRALARAELERIRQQGADDLFEALASELPDRQWQRVHVNPADQQRARARFPRADVVCDAGIAGGMAVEAEDGRIRVSNTLEARLETAWPDILPGLVEGILAETADHRTAA